MSEQKFKVVKCLKNIPEELWGRVVKDDTIWSISNGSAYTYKSSDTFPMPEQGDKVEVSYDDGEEWREHGNWYFSSHLPILSNPFIVYDDDKDIPSAFKYIRPAEEDHTNASLKGATHEDGIIMKLTEIGADVKAILDYMKNG